MPHEVVYQKYMIDGVDEMGGYGLKMSNAFLAGVPDMLLKLPAWGQPQIWEAKKETYQWIKVGGLPQPILINTTPLQKKTLRDMRKSGIQVAVIVILPGPGRSVTLALTRDIDQRQIQREEFNRCHYVRSLGEPWGQAILRLNELVPP